MEDYNEVHDFWDTAGSYRAWYVRNEIDFTEETDDPKLVSQEDIGIVISTINKYIDDPTDLLKNLTIREFYKTIADEYQSKDYNLNIKNKTNKMAKELALISLFEKYCNWSKIIEENENLMEVWVDKTPESPDAIEDLIVSFGIDRKYANIAKIRYEEVQPEGALCNVIGTQCFKYRMKKEQKALEEQLSSISELDHYNNRLANLRYELKISNEKSFKERFACIKRLVNSKGIPIEEAFGYRKIWKRKVKPSIVGNLFYRLKELTRHKINGPCEIILNPNKKETKDTSYYMERYTKRIEKIDFIKDRIKNIEEKISELESKDN